MKLHFLALIVALAPGIPSVHSSEPRKKPAPENPPAAEPKEPRSMTGRPLPYRARITAIDEQAATFSSAGKGGASNVFAITDKTTITQDGKPATFGDLAVGKVVTGVRTRTVGGEWEVATVNIQALGATPKPRGAKKEVAPPAVPPKAADPAKPAEPEADAKPGEKKAE